MGLGEGRWRDIWNVFRARIAEGVPGVGPVAELLESRLGSEEAPPASTRRRGGGERAPWGPPLAAFALITYPPAAR